MSEEPSRALQAWLRDEGEALEELPWARPRDAYGWLSSAKRRRVDALVAALDGTWCSEGAHLDAARAFAALDPRSRIAFYPGAPPGGPSWFLQSVTTGHLSTKPIRNLELLPEVRLYEVEGDDPFAGRPATLAALARRASRREYAIPFTERILAPNDAHRQLRMVLYRGSRATLYVGWYRRRHEPRFDVEEHALLLAARPALRRWSRVASAIGVAPLGDGALVAALGALDRPALLLRRGRVAFANAAGAQVAGEVRSWSAAGRPPGFATVTPLAPSGLEVELVLPFESPASAPWLPGATAPTPAGAVQKAGALPPYLARVAELVAEGLADKEIAIRLDMPLHTTRTYVARAMRRLGLHDRRALILGQSNRGAP